MSDPVFPDDHCVETLRATVAILLRARPSPQQCCEGTVKALHDIEEAGACGDWLAVASHAGTIASFALVLLLDALARMPAKGKA